MNARLPAFFTTSRPMCLPQRLRALLGSLLLVVALVAVQQGVLQHAISHLQEHLGQSSSKGHLAAEQCGKCLALASLTGAPSASPQLDLPTASAAAPCAQPLSAYRPAGCFPFSSRAPPSLQP
jgi:hypothetical protein